jgi:hypothetical protein
MTGPVIVTEKGCVTQPFCLERHGSVRFLNDVQVMYFSPLPLTFPGEEQAGQRGYTPHGSEQ